MFWALLCPSSGARDYDVNCHIGRFVLGLLYVGVQVRLGLSSVRAAARTLLQLNRIQLVFILQPEDNRMPVETRSCLLEMFNLNIGIHINHSYVRQLHQLINSFRTWISVLEIAGLDVEGHKPDHPVRRTWNSYGASWAKLLSYGTTTILYRKQLELFFKEEATIENVISIINQLYYGSDYDPILL